MASDILPNGAALAWHPRINRQRAAPEAKLGDTMRIWCDICDGEGCRACDWTGSVHQPEGTEGIAPLAWTVAVIIALIGAVYFFDLIEKGL